MSFIRLIPKWLCIACLLVMWVQLNMNILLLLFIYTVSFSTGYSINRIPYKFPEDEAEPYFQISLNKVAIIMFGIAIAIGSIIA